MSHEPDVRVGPQSLAEFFAWPNTILQRLFKRGDDDDLGRMHRVHALLAGENFVYSDYSGLSGEYEILSQLESALNEWLRGESMAPVTFRHARVCDFGETQQIVLRFISRQQQSSGKVLCVMNDILDRLCPTARTYVTASLPEPGMPPEHAAAAYAGILEWLIANRQWVYGDHTSLCLAHGRACKLCPRCDADEPAQVQGCSLEDGGSGASSSEPAFKRGKVSSFSRRGVRINFAGNTCKGWSMVGKQRFFSDPSELAHSVWIVERRLLAEMGQEDAFVSECTVKYPVQAWCGCDCHLGFRC